MLSFRSWILTSPMDLLYRGAWLLVCLFTTACIGVDEDFNPPRTGDIVPHFEVTDLKDGQKVSLTDFRGNTVLVNLWATWCEPCRFETPYLESVYKEYHERGLKIAGISVDSRGSLNAVKQFLSDNGVTYDILLDPDRISTDIFAVMGLPSSFLIAEDGIILFDRVGPIFEDDPQFLSALEDALN